MIIKRLIHRFTFLLPFEKQPKGDKNMGKKIAFDATKPVSVFDEPTFIAILKQETEGITENDIKSLWNQYSKKNFSLQLILNKASALKREMNNITEEREVVLLGNRDHIWTSMVEGKKVFNEPFQSFVTGFDFKKNAFETFTLDGKVTAKSRGIQWGKRCIVGCHTTTQTKNGKTFTNIYISKVLKIIGDVDFTELLKDKAIPPEHVMKKWVDKYPIVILYGEIDKFDLEKMMIETEEANSLVSIPVYTSPITKTNAKMEEKIPTFQFSIKSPEEVKEGKNKVVKCRLMSQVHGRSVFDVKGWTDDVAKDIARCDKEELSQEDFDAMVEDMNSYFGNRAVKVFVIGTLTKAEKSKKSDTFYYTINATYVVQTDFKPQKIITPSESESRVFGKLTSSSTGESASDDRVTVIPKIQNSVKVVGGAKKMTYENLAALGIFKEFSIPEPRLKRIVEKVKTDLLAGKDPSKQEAKTPPKPKEEPKEEEPTEETDESTETEEEIEKPEELDDEEEAVSDEPSDEAEADDDAVEVDDDEFEDNT